eukprot:m.10747 g.10747  ORF g.10747 m.10747 type:complete len:743 (+) comp4353_c0_seq1:56-2284(+)
MIVVLRVRKVATGVGGPRSLGLELAGGSGAPVTVAAISPGGAVATQCFGQINVGDEVISIRGRIRECDRHVLPPGRAATTPAPSPPPAAATAHPTRPTFGWLPVTSADSLTLVQDRLASAGDIVELRVQRDPNPGAKVRRTATAGRASSASPEFAPWDAGWHVLSEEQADSPTPSASAAGPAVLSKLHWKPIDVIDPRCSCCRKSLGALIRRPGWCALCGEVVCSSCLTARRRLLSDPAQPEAPPRFDPTGVLARVCPGCATSAGHSIGPNGKVIAELPPQAEPTERSRTTAFHAARARQVALRRAVGRHAAAGRTVSSGSSSFADLEAEGAAAPEIDIRGNCARLVSAYSASVSTLSRRISRVLSPTTPAWARVNRPGSDELAPTDCDSCHSKFTAFKRREHCAICGRVYCGSCVFRSALLYLDGTGKATITVLSPDAKLPPRSELVEACGGCLDAVEEIVNARLKPPVSTTWDTLVPVDATLRADATRITKSLDEFRGLVDSLRPDGPSSTSPGRGLVPRIAKHQSDLERLLDVFRGNLNKLQQIAPESKTFETLHKNMTKGRATFLRENISTLRELNRVLELLLPPEVLAVVTDVVNKDALIASSILITQLAVESTLMNSKALALTLDSVARGIRDELKVLIDKDGPEAWDACLDALSKTIQARGKEAPLLRHLAALPGARQKMVSRVVEVLQQLRWQLEHRATLAAIASILDDLDQAIEKVPGQVIEAAADTEGWEVV